MPNSSTFAEQLDDLICNLRYEAAPLNASDQAAAKYFADDGPAMRVKFCYRATCRSKYFERDGYGIMLFSSHPSRRDGWGGDSGQKAQTEKQAQSDESGNKAKPEKRKKDQKEYGPRSTAMGLWRGEIYGPGSFCTKNGRLAQAYQG